MALFKRSKTEDYEDKDQLKKSDKLKAAAQETSNKKDKSDVIKGSRIAYKVFVHPLLTEKSTIQNSLNQYVFVVADKANKIEIKKAIQELYHVKPTKIRIINVLGKSVRSGRRGGQTTRQKNWKKAIVTIPQGKKIDVYEGI